MASFVRLLFLCSDLPTHGHLSNSVAASSEAESRELARHILTAECLEYFRRVEKDEEFGLPQSCGRPEDRQFAAGLLEATRCCMPDSQIGEVHLRPVARLSSEFGRVEGDVGFNIAIGGANILVVVEREGSGPGNERNLLKWYEAVRSGAPVRFTDGKRQLPCEHDEVLVLLAFCRGDKWTASDCSRTVSFCQMLADLLNERATRERVPFTAVVVGPDVLDDWCSVGGRIGAQMSELLAKVYPAFR